MQIVDNLVRCTVERGYRLSVSGARGDGLWAEIGDFPSMGCVGSLSREICARAKASGCGVLVLTSGGAGTAQGKRLAGEICRLWGGALYASPRLDCGIPLVVPAVSGGTLEDYLRQQPRPYALWLRQVHMDFRLPARTGAGTEITREQGKALLEQTGSSIFFSRELCTRYFSYRTRDGTHFVLTDDKDTIREKIKVGGRCGAEAGIIPAQSF